MIARWRLIDFSSRLAAAIWSFILAMPGSMPMMPPMPPSFSICASCSERSLRSKTPLRIFSAILAAFSMSIVFGRLLDEADDVAHAEDAVGEAARDGNPPARPSFRRRRAA